MAAATVLSVAGLASLSGKIVCGARRRSRRRQAHRWWPGSPSRRVAISFYLFTARASRASTRLALMFGFAYGGVMPLYAILVREYFGARIMGTASARSRSRPPSAWPSGRWSGGWLYDAFGSYAWLFIGSSAIGLGAVAIALTFRPAGPPRPPRCRARARPAEGGDRAMRFLLLMYREERIWDAKPEAERVAIRQQAIDASRPLRERGVFLAGDPLLPTSTAVTVRIAGGKPVATDGPFAETKEQLGGYSVVDVPSMKEAVAIALDHPLVRVGGHSIEVRPIRELPQR